MTAGDEVREALEDAARRVGDDVTPAYLIGVAFPRLPVGTALRDVRAVARDVLNDRDRRERGARGVSV